MLLGITKRFAKHFSISILDSQHRFSFQFIKNGGTDL